MGFPFSVPHVAPLDSPIGEWDRRCRVCSNPQEPSQTHVNVCGFSCPAEAPHVGLAFPHGKKSLVSHPRLVTTALSHRFGSVRCDWLPSDSGMRGDNYSHITVRSPYKRRLIRHNLKEEWPTRTGMEDSQPILFCKRFSYTLTRTHCITPELFTILMQTTDRQTIIMQRVHHVLVLAFPSLM